MLMCSSVMVIWPHGVGVQQDLGLPLLLTLDTELIRISQIGKYNIYSERKSAHVSLKFFAVLL